MENFVFGCTVQHKKLWITAGGKDLTSSKILLMMDNMIVTTLGRKATQAVRSIIVQAVQEVLGDPDFGLELSAREAAAPTRTYEKAKNCSIFRNQSK